MGVETVKIFTCDMCGRFEQGDVLPLRWSWLKKNVPENKMLPLDSFFELICDECSDED